MEASSTSRRSLWCRVQGLKYLEGNNCSETSAPIVSGACAHLFTGIACILDFDLCRVLMYSRRSVGPLEGFIVNATL